MYLDHFGLREAPFRITPHTEFFFAGANRGATLEALIYAITYDEGIVKVSGEVGSGKTMLCRMLLERLPAHVETVYLANPSLSRDEILHAIADELRAPLPDGRPHLLHALQERLLEIHAAGHQVVVMIDEAHAMPAETLEEIRLLSNLETNRHKLLHIVLFGQPELDAHLRQTKMRPLKERITHNFALEPLHRGDIANYLMFRLRAAGYRGPDLFTAGAIARIGAASEGLTRRINILADKALLAAFAEDRHIIDQKQIKAAISDAQINPISDDKARPARWLAALGGVLLLAILTGLAGSHRTASVQPPAVITTAAASVAIEAPPAALPPPEAADSAAPSAPPPGLAERIAASEDWLKQTPGGHYVIQLLNTDGDREREVVDFLASNALPLDQQRLHVYRSQLSGRDRIGVVYGDYPSHRAANAELPVIAKASQGGHPYVRAVSKLR